MSSLTEKELAALNDALCEEELLVKKFQMMAEQTSDRGVKNTFEKISKQHQGHFDALYAQLR